ncbi:hypothetical protein [Mesorhizobium delmotii]|uniref:Uncharacterized protein n=1 Tax=Mesorhizobium delmotii TaxID=1631247 RepID=A0A2P9AS51_9HYPH|nr:hypothetical protein [Mesorhizobium delmotii]SJM33982.1 hypothetical protein BQ8482_380165 [Mesorhizobium delmotii]
MDTPTKIGWGGQPTNVDDKIALSPPPLGKLLRFTRKEAALNQINLASDFFMRGKSLAGDDPIHGQLNRAAVGLQFEQFDQRHGR